MRKLLIDVNVVLDVLLDRQPHGRASAAVWAAVESGRAEGLLSAHAVTTIHYLVARERGAAFARRAIAALLQVFRVATVDQLVVQRACSLHRPTLKTLLQRRRRKKRSATGSSPATPAASVSPRCEP